jgi:hypothetical protein
MKDVDAAMSKITTAMLGVVSIDYRTLRTGGDPSPVLSVDWASHPSPSQPTDL